MHLSSTRLPDDCLRSIFSYLDALSVLASAGVSKQWRAVAMSCYRDVIEFDSSRLRCLDTEKLFSVLSRFPSLKKLRLHSPMTNKALECFKGKPIEVIDLLNSMVTVGDIGEVGLNFEMIREMSVSNFPKMAFFLDDDIESIQQFVNLRKLHIYGYRFHPRRLESLFARTTSLSEITFERCEFQPAPAPPSLPNQFVVHPSNLTLHLHSESLNRVQFDQCTFTACLLCYAPLSSMEIKDSFMTTDQLLPMLHCVSDTLQDLALLSTRGRQQYVAAQRNSGAPRDTSRPVSPETSNSDARYLNRMDIVARLSDDDILNILCQCDHLTSLRLHGAPSVTDRVPTYLLMYGSQLSTVHLLACNVSTESLRKLLEESSAVRQEHGEASVLRDLRGPDGVRLLSELALSSLASGAQH
eukprot:Rmarinus@m.14555